MPESVDDLLREALDAILTEGVRVPPISEPTSPHSGFGDAPRGTIEVRNWVATTSKIRDRILRNPERGARLDRAIGMTLWSLGASDELDAVAFYNPNAARFTDDAVRIRAPWGKRILGGWEESPLGVVLEMLRRDPYSLRAEIPIYRPEDVAVSSRDVPCLTALHLLQRDGELHMTCFLRSVNPYWVWPYDHFFLTILLEFCACLLSVEAGTLTYLVSSLQIAETDEPMVRAALARDVPVAETMAPMPAESGWDDLRELSRVESKLRRLLGSPACSAAAVTRLVDDSALPEWWGNLLLATAGLRLEATGSAEAHPILARLPGWTTTT